MGGIAHVVGKHSGHVSEYPLSVHKYYCVLLMIIDHSRGLIAGTTWGRIWPEHKMKIIAVSSIYEASVKVRITELVDRHSG
jgi:hypothetical protein